MSYLRQIVFGGIGKSIARNSRNIALVTSPSRGKDAAYRKDQFMEVNQQEPASLSGNPQKKSWRKRIAIVGIAIVAFAGVGVAGALSQDYGHGGPDMHTQANFRHGMGFGERSFERMLEEIDATPEQEKELKAIRDKYLDGLRPITLGLVNTLEDLDKLQTIDRETAEKLRAALVAAFDEASRKLTPALLDGAAVLTAEQRAKLVVGFLLGDVDKLPTIDRKAMKKLAERRFELMLEEIDATPEQEVKLKAIRDKFSDGLRPIMLGLVCPLNDVSKLPTIDREAAEKLRAALVAAFDEASRKLTTALLDGAAVLTPEQLEKLGS
ncbi:Spy/CpxP family protein refolding chaperone [Mesorhizobium sp. M1216]|uniref:Spy/CpxP family protein refolding chaperone n=1 Tax=Mesorhizobium sp. M1216 TaxID=2957069 RepID=UPI00333A4368